MLSITEHLDPHLFTELEPLLDTRILDLEVFQPKERFCPFCTTPLITYKTIPSRNVQTLDASRDISERQLYCPNPACLGRVLDPTSGKSRPRIFTSPDLRLLVLEKMHYGLDVVLEVGRRAYTDSKSGRQVRHEFLRDYGFAPTPA